MNTTPAHTSHAAAPEISPAAPRSPSRRSGKASAPITPSSASARSSDDDDDDEEEEDDDDENESNEDDASPYLSLLVPGALVNVAPRTWPGINKIGGTGKVISAFDGLLLCAPQLTALACRCNSDHTYDIALVLGGSERNVEAKYVTLQNLDAQPQRKPKTREFFADYVQLNGKRLRRLEKDRERQEKKAAKRAASESRVEEERRLRKKAEAEDADARAEDEARKAAAARRRAEERAESAAADEARKAEAKARRRHEAEQARASPAKSPAAAAALAATPPVSPVPRVLRVAVFDPRLPLGHVATARTLEPGGDAAPVAVTARRRREARSALEARFKTEAARLTRAEAEAVHKESMRIKTQADDVLALSPVEHFAMRADAGWAPVRIDASSARARFADIRSRERQRQELEADALYAAQLAEVALESLAGEALDERVDRVQPSC